MFKMGWGSNWFDQSSEIELRLWEIELNENRKTPGKIGRNEVIKSIIEHFAVNFIFIFWVLMQLEHEVNDGHNEVDDVIEQL